MAVGERDPQCNKHPQCSLDRNYAISYYAVGVHSVLPNYVTTFFMATSDKGMRFCFFNVPYGEAC